MSTGPKAAWGGARTGAGRPRKTVAQQRIDQLLRTAKKYAKKHDKSVDDILLDVIYAVGAGADANLAQQIKAIQTFYAQTMPSQSELSSAFRCQCLGLAHVILRFIIGSRP